MKTEEKLEPWEKDIEAYIDKRIKWYSDELKELQNKFPHAIKNFLDDEWFPVAKRIQRLDHTKHDDWFIW